jgi:putative transposase
MLPLNPMESAKTVGAFRPLERGVEQDHRSVKWGARPMLGFKSFDAAQCTLVGVELMHMLKKGQLAGDEREGGLTPAEQFYALAA